MSTAAPAPLTASDYLRQAIEAAQRWEVHLLAAPSQPAPGQQANGRPGDDEETVRTAAARLRRG